MKSEKNDTERLVTLRLLDGYGHEGANVIQEWKFHADASGVAGLIRAVDSSTTEAGVSRALGIKRRRKARK